MSIDLYDRFVTYLQHYAVGASQAQTAVTICGALGLEPNENSRRALRSCAEQASRCGVLLCSGQRGYYLPNSPAEVLTTTRRLRSDAGELWDRAKRMDRLAAAHFELRDEPSQQVERAPMFAMMEAEA